MSFLPIARRMRGPYASAAALVGRRPRALASRDAMGGSQRGKDGIAPLLDLPLTAASTGICRIAAIVASGLIRSSHPHCLHTYVLWLQPCESMNVNMKNTSAPLSLSLSLSSRVCHDCWASRQGVLMKAEQTNAYQTDMC